MRSTIRWGMSSLWLISVEIIQAPFHYQILLSFHLTLFMSSTWPSLILLFPSTDLNWWERVIIHVCCKCQQLYMIVRTLSKCHAREFSFTFVIMEFNNWMKVVYNWLWWTVQPYSVYFHLDYDCPIVLTHTHILICHVLHALLSFSQLFAELSVELLKSQFTRNMDMNRLYVHDILFLHAFYALCVLVLWSGVRLKSIRTVWNWLAVWWHHTKSVYLADCTPVCTKLSNRLQEWPATPFLLCRNIFFCSCM